jgi:hypothetical protein
MITIRPTTIGSLVLELPYCTQSQAAAVGLGERKEGHTQSIIQEDEFDEFLIALLEARAKVRREKEKGGAK